MCSSLLVLFFIKLQTFQTKVNKRLPNIYKLSFCHAQVESSLYKRKWCGVIKNLIGSYEQLITQEINSIS